jgi:hypothetical protein
MVLVRPEGFVARRFYGTAGVEAGRFLADTFAYILRPEIAAGIRTRTSAEPNLATEA